MGMAASQARLLALTTRMHNIELRAQNIENQKLELAVREDEAYQKYCDALDAKKIQVGYMDYLSGKMSYIDANYSTVCGYHDEYACQFSLINNKTGKVIVTPEIKDIYDRYGNDKYTFALMASGYNLGSAGWADQSGPFGEYLTDYSPCAASLLIGINTNDGNYIDPSEYIYIAQWAQGEGYGYSDLVPGYGNDLYMNEVEYLVFCDNVAKQPELREKYEALLEASMTPNVPAGTRQQLLQDFRDCLYDTCRDAIIRLMNCDKSGGFVSYHDGVYEDDFGPVSPNNSNVPSNGEMNYFMNLWEQINQAGGCETLDAQYQSGEEGTEWFNNMVNAGMISIFTLKPGDDGWKSTTLATSVGNNYLQEVNDDEKAKRAEVEYEHELKIINRKDTKFDNELKKLETEESACKTEIDSVKKIIQDNIEKNFNLFS